MIIMGGGAGRLYELNYQTGDVSIDFGGAAYLTLNDDGGVLPIFYLIESCLMRNLSIFNTQVILSHQWVWATMALLKLACRDNRTFHTQSNYFRLYIYGRFSDHSLENQPKCPEILCFETFGGKYYLRHQQFD